VPPDFVISLSSGMSIAKYLSGEFQEEENA